MNVDKKSMRLYAVTDRTWLGKNDLAAQVEDALRGGVSFLQLREKYLDHDAFVVEAVRMRAVCDRYHVPFVINDSVAVALESGADGVHVGQSDLAAGDVRAMIGDDKILGVSVATVEQARAAQAAGADYLGVGAVYSTSTKTDARPVSHQLLQEICAAVTIPVVAIGGITTQNIAQLSGSGVDGVAVVSALFAQPDIYAAACTLRTLSERMAGASLTAAIFDMDGTLLDSMYIWTDAGACFLHERGIKADDRLYETLRAMSLEQCAVYFHDELGVLESPAQIVAEINRRIVSEYRDSAPLKAGVSEFLERLHSLGIRLCVATATARPLAEIALSRLDILRYFDFVITCPEVGAGKDTPLIFEQALARLGTQKSDTVVFEDALHAIQTAKAAEFRVVAVSDPSAASDAPAIREIADRYIEHYSAMDADGVTKNLTYL